MDGPAVAGVIASPTSEPTDSRQEERSCRPSIPSDSTGSECWNAICPGPTETPLALANEELWLGFGADYREATGTEVSSPLEQAYPLLFLCSDAARGVNGIIMITDAGYVSAGISGAFPAATPVANFLLGRG